MCLCDGIEKGILIVGDTDDMIITTMDTLLKLARERFEYVEMNQEIK